MVLASKGFDRDRPFNDLPSLPPPDELETKRVLKRAIGANKALAELKGVGDLIPNQGILIRAVSLQEAKLSSEIENIVTTNDELYRAFSDDKKSDPHTKEVLHYSDALWHGYSALKSENRTLGTRLIEEIAAIIKQSDAGIRRVPGTKIANAAREVVYTPPEGETLIRDKLKNLEDFMYVADDLDPLVKLAVVHYQFEAIHPFADGNGRTGRILNILYLVEMGLLDTPVLYLSQFIIEHKAAYYDGLRRVTEEGAWESWVLYMLQAVEETAIQTRDRILAIRRVMVEAQELVKAELPKIYSKDLIEILFQRPYCKIRFLEEAGIARRQTASSYLQELEGIGLLRGTKVGREMYYVNVPFFAELTR